MYTPDGRRLSIDGGDVRAVVIDRGRFDEELLGKAQGAGVEVRVGCRATGLEGTSIRLQEDGEARVEEARVEEARVYIGADGPQSRVAKWAGLSGPKKVLFAVQAMVPYRSQREDFVEVYFGRDVAPNFFAWAVPASDGLARVGLASDDAGNLRLLLGRLLENRFSSKEIVEMGGGMIPVGLPARTVTVSERYHSKRASYRDAAAFRHLVVFKTPMVSIFNQAINEA